MDSLLSITVWLGVVLLVAGVPLVLYVLLRRSLPMTDGVVHVAGIGAPVQVMRDSDGVPHIYGRTSEDVHFGLGYVHAQDRLWQMEYQRRFAAGRLAEIFGATAAKADLAMRTLGLRAAADRALTQLSPFAVAALESYVRGINEAVRNQSGLRRPLECQLLRMTIEPWTPLDVVTSGKLMAWNLAGTYTGDLLRTEMQAKVGLERTAVLMSFRDDARGQVEELAAEPVGVAAALASSSTGPFEVHAGGSEGAGSNQWVVDGMRSVTGKPVLANDPHLPASMPGTWYLAHLSAPDLDVIGATVPGLPAIIAGRNRSVAWGVASLDVDVQDLFAFSEHVDADDSSQSSEPAAPVWRREEVIKCRGTADVRTTIRTTRHGPIISEILGKRENGAAAPPLALRWTALDDQDSTLEAFLRINSARDWTEFSEAFQAYVAPVLLFTYADVTGNIGSRMAGRVPHRSGCDGSVVVPGGGGEWNGCVPAEEMPASYNPGNHVIVSANTREAGPGYRWFLGREHIEPHRRERIWELLHADPLLTIHDHVAIQLDTLSTQARKLVPLLLPHIRPEGALERTVLELLRSWDCDMRRGSAAAAVFAAWWRELPKAAVSQELGQDLFKAYELWPSYTDRFVRERLLALASTTSVPEEDGTGGTSIQSAIRQSFTHAVAGVRQRLGPDSTQWRWDRLHRAVFAHRPLHRYRWLRRFVSRSIPTGGDWSSVNVGGTWSYDQPFKPRYVAGYRQILDLSNPDGGLFIQAVGQSGHVLSKHYADMATRWQQGEYIPMRMSRDAVAKATRAVLHLEPRTEHSAC